MMIKRCQLIKIWFLIFLYIVVVGLLFQLLLLPTFFPDWHAGDGLLKNGDWNGFHRLALNLLDEMEAEGWSAWQLRPREQAPAGIAAAVYKITRISKPWILLPINALIHSSSAILLLFIVGTVTGKHQLNILSILSFIFFPTALLWNIQFHKEGFFILGSFLFLYSILMINNDKEKSIIFSSLKNFLFFMSGIFLIWIVRPYGVEMVLYIGALLICIKLLEIIINFRSAPTQLYKIGIIVFAFAIAFPLTSTGIHHQYVVVDYEEINENGKITIENDTHTKNQDTLVNAEKKSTDITDKINDGDIINSENVLIMESGSEAWEKSSILPSFIDENLFKMSALRERYLEHKPDAGSNIDTHKLFSSSVDVLGYLPRALQIGLLAPFPKHWFATGTSILTTIMRRVSAAEMIIIYLSFLGFIAGCWYWRRKINLIITAGFAVGMILTYSIVVPNIGTLHRMRYGFIMILVAVGVAAFQELWKRRSEVGKS